MSLEAEINSIIQKGSLEVICGSMFSGKTEELLKRINRACLSKKNVKTFKPELDKRYDNKKIVSHNKNTIKTIAVCSATDILEFIDDTDVIGIDEAQFFDSDLLLVCNILIKKGKRIIISGLDMDFSGKPFGIMPELLAIADHITKLRAVCIDCGSNANHSFRKTLDKNLVKLGEKESYKPLCRICFNKANLK